MQLLGILGPTAVGKTHIAICLAKQLNTEIISADSMQIYRGLNIGTAKITKKDAQGIFHHMVDIIDPDQTFSSFEYAKECNKIINNMTQKSKIPLIVGGTGFYFDALLYPISYTDEGKDEIRKQLKKELTTHGAHYLLNKLKRIDPISAQDIHPNNTVRLIRALEIYYATGCKKSDLIRPTKYAYPITLIVLNCGRQILYERINNRVDQMIKLGLVDEVKGLLKTYPPDSQCFSAIGYKEIFDYLKGESSLEQATELIKKKTRNYAKRQLTFFKRFKNAVWINTTDFADKQEIVNNILEIYQNEASTSEQ